MRLVSIEQTTKFLRISTGLLAAVLIAGIWISGAFASPLADKGLRLINIGAEVNSRDIILEGQALLVKAALKWRDADALYEIAKQVRSGNILLGYAPMPRSANQILWQLAQRNYDPALYEYGLYLLDGTGGAQKNELLALTLFERSFEQNGNPNSAFIAAVMRHESLAPGTKTMDRIEALLQFAIVHRVKGAARYQKNMSSGYWQLARVKSWREWLKNQTN